MTAPMGWTGPTVDGGRFRFPTERTPRLRGVRLLPVAGAAPLSDVAGLLDADPDFDAAVPAADRALAGVALRLPCLSLHPGAWLCPPPGDAAPVGLLVRDGLISRSVERYGRASVELYGPGDLIAPEPHDGAVYWDVHQPSSVIVLDQRFVITARRWPDLWRVVVERTAQRAERLVAHLAALQLSRVDDRIHAVLWQLAERWGRVTAGGVVVPVALTHALLGCLTAAKRPTVSVALALLAEEGRVTRRPDGGWLLRP